MIAKSRIVLINMPLVQIERPSLSLGLLKSILAEANLPSTILYANMWFLEYVGLATYRALIESATEDAITDWLFAGIAFPDFEPDHEAFFDKFARRRSVPAARTAELKRNMPTLRARMAGFIDWVADKVLALDPEIVGCTSTFQQNVASLALLRRIRERAPDIVSLMGGANCETVMGQTLHEQFPWVDYVVSGEADTIVGPLFHDILNRGRDIPAAELAFGVFGPVHRHSGYPSTTTGDFVPRAVTEDLRQMPLPDYSEYFTEIRESLYGKSIHPGIPMEFSRGCWWGERSHCTFCGLNGSSMSYRQKPAERVADEIFEMAGRYGSPFIEAVDNILALDYIDKALPKLEAQPEKLEIFFEVKANLKRHEVERLSAAGVRWTQPGIESLDTRVLKLMAKGTTAAHNVLLLKWCRQYGMRLSWSILWGFPGEHDDWYGEAAGMLPLLHHLQPTHMVRLRYHRYSPYHRHPEKYGLKLNPFDAYRYIYPLSEQKLHDLAYYFDSESDNAGDGTADAVAPGVRSFADGMDAWWDSWRRPEAPMLLMRASGDELLVEDTRDVAVARHHRIAGLSRQIMLIADEGAPEARTREKLAEGGVSPADLNAAIDDLTRRKLILRMDSRLVGLPLWDPYTPLLSPYRFPGGFFDPYEKHTTSALVA